MSNSSVTEEDITPFNTVTTILGESHCYVLCLWHLHSPIYHFTSYSHSPTRSPKSSTLHTFAYAYQATLEFTFTKNQDWASFLAYLQHDKAMTIAVGFDQILPLCLVVMADLMLLHCCYVLWGSSKWIAYLFISMVLLLAICEIVASVFIVIGISNSDPARWQLYLQGNAIDTAFWLAEMGVNILLTLLTAGRIWWISREARKHMGPVIKSKYNTIVAIILESGILYPIFLTTSLIYTLLLDKPDVTGSMPFNLFSISYQVAGIAPTLIIIRAAGGKTVEHTSMNQVISSLHFADGAGPGSGSLDTGSHVQVVDVETRSLAEGIQDPGKRNSV
uniref:Uncharacterized protein n=1 Tax=Moniliophthora roreri TaxID=221103 RepID=A0A0W0EZ20_MONRR